MVNTVIVENEQPPTSAVCWPAIIAVGQREVPVHWLDICRVMRMMGLMEDFSKGECRRISALLKKRIKAGTTKKLSRCVYTGVYPDQAAPDDEAP